MNAVKRFAPSALIFLTGAAFLLYGIYRGEVNTVFQKAITICLECIGIG